jgi:hypothetical protein
MLSSCLITSYDTFFGAGVGKIRKIDSDLEIEITDPQKIPPIPKKY